MDSWANLKIPMLESLGGTAVDGWLPVTSNATVYSSLIGVPVSAVSMRDNATFAMETSYWTVDCPLLQEGFPDPRLNTSGEGWASGEYYSWGFASLWVNQNTPEGFARKYGEDPNMAARRLYYHNYDEGASGNVTYAECEMRTSYVEVRVSCQARSCAAVAMRESTLPHLPSNWTFLDQSYQTLMGYVRQFHTAVDANMYSPSVMQRYFVDPGSPISVTNAPPLYSLGQKSFSTSLAQLMNTFWIAGVGPTVVTGGIPNSNAELRNGTRLLQASNVTVSHAQEILVCDKRWLAALLVSTSAMFIAGVIGLTLGFLRKGPDLAMDIATMTRDNPYMNLPQGGSALDCAERSRLLRNVRVRFGDVAPHGEVGYAAIGSLVDEKEVDVLKEERLYA
ncbi:hypothetical protein H2199_005124 [Coniosporium tulheliwenetii]|nr:hypothetical protein H2199_005124 [Cladosporium sp. JES 115]